MREAITGSIVGGRRLAIHLVVRSSRLTEALRGGDVGFGSVLRTGNHIALNLDGLLRFAQILTQLLESRALCVDLLVQVINILKQQLLLRLNLSKPGLVLGKIVVHVFVRLVQVLDLVIFLL